MTEINKITPEIFESYNQILFFVQQSKDLDTCGGCLGLLKLIESKFPDKVLKIICCKLENKRIPVFDKYVLYFGNIHKLDRDLHTLGIIVDAPGSRNISHGSGKFIDLCHDILIFDHHERDGQEVWNIQIKTKLLKEFNDPNYGSCCEYIWDLIDKKKFKVTKEIAFPLLCGIYSDTRGFTSNLTTPETLKKVYEMLQLGITIKEAFLAVNQFEYVYAQIFADVINKCSVMTNKVLLLNLPEEIVREKLPRMFDKMPDTRGRIRQTRIFTYLLNWAEANIRAETYIFIHYSLFQPENTEKKLIYIVMTKKNLIAESILKQYGFKKQRERWIKSDMSLKALYDLIYVKYPKEFGIKTSQNEIK